MHIEDGGVRLVVGLLEPPLLAKTAVGKDIGAPADNFAKHRVESGIETKLTLAAADAVLMAIHDYAEAETVRMAATNPPKNSFAQIDGRGVKERQAGLAEAQARMAG